MKKAIYICLCALTALSAAAARPRAKAKAADVAALQEKAEEALMMYDCDALSEAIEKWNDALKRNAEKPERLAQLERKQIALDNMLQRVEKIVILDSLSVDAADFFKHYRLSADAGRIAGTGSTTNGMPLTSFTTAGSGEIFYTVADTSGHLAVMRADILDDGTRDHAVDTGIGPADSNSAFPFMMADGMTLYFASDADTDASLGGYDIYRTSRDDEGNFLEATNLGMPYNSPANDYMLAIDETSGAGWWATDRNAEDGKVTIYIFVPNASRINYDPTLENITDLAFITSVAETRPADCDVEARLRAIDEASTAADDNDTAKAPFMLSLGDGRIYTSYADFRNDRARRAMHGVVDLQRIVDAYKNQLDKLRQRYASGERGAGARIEQLESELAQKSAELLTKRNTVIKQERN